MSTSAKEKPEKQQSNKKLQPFFKEKEKASKRYKSVLAYIESPDHIEEEEKKFFNDNYEGIFEVTFEKFEESEESFKKGKGLKDLLGIFGILKKIIVYLAPLINAKWHIEQIGSIITKSLALTNHQSVRLWGFELLLHFIESLQNSVEDTHLNLYASAINLHPFIPANANVILRTTSFTKIPISEMKAAAEEASEALFPTTEAATKQDAIELLDCFLDFITNKSSNFLFWFNLFKERYMKLLYPSIFQELRLMDKLDGSGFKALCPPEIQAVLIDRIAAWGDRPQIFSLVWDPDSNGPIMIEIHKQTCLLRMTFASTIKKSMQIFRSWILNFQKNKIFADQLQDYWQKFIKNLSLIFTTPTTMDEVDALHSLCREVLIVYTYFAVELAHKLTKETWESLQYTVLLTTFDLINKTSSDFSSPDIAPIITALLNKQAPNPLQKNGKNDTFADHLFAALYFFWIRSGITTEDMWKDMSKKVAFCTDWKANLNQWKEKVLQLTYIMRDYLYETSEKNPLKVNPNNLSADDVDESFVIKRASEDDSFIKSTGKSAINNNTNSSILFIRDPRLAAINWTPQSIQHLWSIMLNILGNPTKISEPASYEIAMSCIYEVVEILVDAEEKQPLGTAPPINIMKLFLPWLIEACTYDEQLMKGMLIAYRAVLSLFCRRHQTDSPAELTQLLSHFYRIIQMGLSATNQRVVWEVLEYSTSIFCYDLPGVAVLIPDFIRETEVLLGPMMIRDAPTVVKQNALTIINSLISYPNHFEGLEFPVAEIIRPYETIQREPFWTSSQVKDKISKALLSVLASLNEEGTTYLIALCGATVLIFEETLHPNPRVEILNKFLNYYIEFAQHPNDTVAITSLECLASISELYGKLSKIDKAIPGNIVSRIAEYLMKVIKPNGESREPVVCSLLMCLRDWLLAEPNDLLSNRADKTILVKVFSSLEMALLGELMSTEKQAPRKTESKSRKETEKKPKERKLKKIVATGKTPSLYELFQEMNNSPTHGSTVIRETAEMVLLQLLNQYNNFPTLASNYADTETTVHFGYNDSMILSLYETSRDVSEAEGTTRKVARLIMRDGVGKYSWESMLETSIPKRALAPSPFIPPGAPLAERSWKYKPQSPSGNQKRSLRPEQSPAFGSRTSLMPNSKELKDMKIPGHSEEIQSGGELHEEDTLLSQSPEQPLKSSSELPVDSPVTDNVNNNSHSSPPATQIASTKTLSSSASLIVPFTRKEQELPKYSEAYSFRDVDMVNQLLVYLSEVLPPSSTSTGIAYPDPKSIGKPDALDSTYEKSILEKINSLESQARVEDNAVSKERTKLPTQPHSFTSLSNFQTCRLLLSNLGFLTHKNAKKFLLLESGPRLLRSLKEFDQIQNREVCKIGVLYVGPGQEDQNAILKNESGSALYEEFTRGIGWTVNLSTHSGYVGGLDRTLKDAVYYATASSEVMYHISTMMPSSTTDEKQIEKKMHIGNDYVHIVWSEHKRDYRPTTISSQFVDVHIIIYPLPNGLFRLQIFRKNKIPFFGTLLDGMVVDKKILSSLVRQTAINASIRAKALTLGSKKPYPLLSR